MTDAPQADAPHALAPGRYLELLRADGERLAEVARQGLDAPVPCCPGWTVRDAVEHTASVYSHKLACMRLQRRPTDDEWIHEPPGGADPLTWYAESLDELLRELEQRGTDSPSFTWWPPDQTSGFWYRRMAQETAVHRVDVEAAYDVVTPVDDALAVDGVDEVLSMMLADDWSDLTPEMWEDVSPEAGAGRTTAVRTGLAGWRVTLQPDRVDVTTEPGETHATVTGEPSELLLWLWGRRPDEVVRIEGDPAVVTALRDRLRLATQ